MKQERKNIIVLIEDEPDHMEMLTEIMSSLPEFTILTAEDCDEALEVIRGAAAGLALIVTDFNLGEKNCGTLLAKLDKPRTRMSTVPRIIVSGSEEADYRGKRFGRYDFWIPKHQAAELLLQTIRRLLSQK